MRPSLNGEEEAPSCQGFGSWSVFTELLDPDQKLEDRKSGSMCAKRAIILREKGIEKRKRSAFLIFSRSENTFICMTVYYREK